MAARMQAGDARRLFEQDAPLARLGVDDGADAALADEGRRMRAGRGIGKQQLHVARAHLAAVDAIVRSGAALDTAHDLKFGKLVIGLGRVAIRVFEGERHLGDIARRPVAGAAEDHIVHLAAAHALGRVLAHRPTQRLDEIRFAATVGADDAGHADIDDELGGVDEGLEAAETKLCELHFDEARCVMN